MPTITTNGTNIYFEEKGAGEPLLLIMGITAPGSVWEKHVAHWAKSFRCILVDNRGVGKSYKPAGPYTSLQMAQDCIGVLDHLGLGAVKVAGVSMGSIIAQRMAIHFPTRVKAMVLMCPWARCDNAAKAIFQHMKDCKARLKPEEFSVYIQLLIFSKQSWDNEEFHAGLLEDRKNAALDPNPQPLIGLEGQAAACVTHDVLEDLAKVNCPVFVLGGEEDIFTPVWMTKEVAAGIPGSVLHIYKKSGHAFHWENMEDFNERVGDWLKDQG
ncbi:alpha/beta hydrolase [Aquiflexum sp. TKW24L]|uniref:alpha/beta fold hydrolase n=1 Tax=Aquiflexum sp. TKW24L TaxID=2942212 RepID=UPI0020BF1EAB|nr:alpha/beta hydrolase [Aquiflexum sp. TKW24L]MCL6259568.1 alpha/beta hydrolase [Aquiflexum sp. TKW24L]